MTRRLIGSEEGSRRTSDYPLPRFPIAWNHVMRRWRSADGPRSGPEIIATSTENPCLRGGARIPWFIESCAFPSPAASIAAKTLESKTAISISGGEQSSDAIKDSVTKAARFPDCPQLALRANGLTKERIRGAGGMVRGAAGLREARYVRRYFNVEHEQS